MIELKKIEISFIDKEGKMFGSCSVLDGTQEEGYLHIDKGDIHKMWPDMFYVMATNPSQAPNHRGVNFDGETVTVFKDKRRGRIYKIVRVLKPEGKDENYITKRLAPSVDGHRVFEHACIGPTRLEIECTGLAILEPLYCPMCDLEVGANDLERCTSCSRVVCPDCYNEVEGKIVCVECN